ncbi:MAG TPA: PLP-dependent transferase [Stellaceae bacterium]|nr:PLP-dependent transferase [Stellaceae bacterium]
MSEDGKTLHPASLAAQALGWVDETTRAVVPPIHLATTYQRDPGYGGGRIYSRADNPSYEQPEALLARLERGAAALTFASGMAAATAVFLALKPGDHVVAPQVMYWALRRWLLTTAGDWGLAVEFVDMTDLARLRAAMRPGATRLVWIETPANPTWAITDIAAAAAIAHAAGALLAIDSTVATPVLTQPIALGADIVMHAATKYLNGHSDVIAGALVAARQDAFWERIIALRAGNGAVLGPVEAWLLLRGMRTLYLRVAQSCRSAQAIAEHFQRHERIRAVLYPGLTAAPGHAIARRQMRAGFGGMLSLCIAGGEAAALAVAARVRLWQRATSLGGVESLIEHRASIEGPDSPAPPDLLRLSVGIEAVDDLIADLEQALAGV